MFIMSYLNIFISFEKYMVVQCKVLNTKLTPMSLISDRRL